MPLESAVKTLQFGHYFCLQLIILRSSIDVGRVPITLSQTAVFAQLWCHELGSQNEGVNLSNTGLE